MNNSQLALLHYYVNWWSIQIDPLTVLWLFCRRGAGGSASTWTWSWLRCADRPTGPSSHCCRPSDWAGSEIWTQLLRYLSQTIEHLGDPVFFLPCRVTEEVTARLLKSASNPIERDGIVATRLCTHKDDVELTNENKLKHLPGLLERSHAVHNIDVSPLRR